MFKGKKSTSGKKPDKKPDKKPGKKTSPTPRPSQPTVNSIKRNKES